MALVMGTDEAGYGPNLGPLVISVSVWETPDGVGVDGLYDRLAGVIAPAGGKKAPAHCSVDPPSASARECAMSHAPVPPIVMGDSKALYASGSGWRHLEYGLWAAMAQRGQQPRTWRGVWQSLAPDAMEALSDEPWHRDYDAPAPSDCEADELIAAGERLRTGLAAAGVRLLDLRSRVIFPREFNDLLECHGLKSTVLSRETLALAAASLEALPPGPTTIICDKHGGRNRYADLLAERFPEHFIEVCGEGRRQSAYRFGPPERRIEALFRMKAESCLPAALASMASKYLRELSMRAFNAFWRERAPELRPTAGYPQDARRFRADVAETLKRLHIDERVFWRAK